MQLTLTQLKLLCIRSLDQRERRLAAWRGAGRYFCPYWEEGGWGQCLTCGEDKYDVRVGGGCRSYSYQCRTSFPHHWKEGVPVFHMKGVGLAFYNVLNLKGLCHGMTFFLMVYKVKSVFSVYARVVLNFLSLILQNKQMPSFYLLLWKHLLV